MKTRSLLTIAVIFTIALSFLTVNCGTGLGDAVDVQKPSVAITYPPANAAIRDEFVLAGTCSDDQGVAKITVTLYKNGFLFEGSGPFQAEIDAASQSAWKDGRQWKLTLNKGTPNPNARPPLVPVKDYPLKDGTYTIQVQGVDTSGRVSDIDSRSFIIDNTPPILILNKPMATGTEKPTSYGRVLKLAGDANDVQNYNLSLYLKQYEGNGDNTLPSNTFVQDIKVEDIKVSGMASDNPLVIAQYYDPGKITDDEDKKARSKIYTDIYGAVSPTKNINKFYYVGIRLKDRTKVYQNPNETSNETTGNETDVYFINNDSLRNTLANIDTYGVKAKDITAVLNGTDSYDEATRALIKDALSEPGNFVKCSSPEDVSRESNIFRLNPDNNPTWAIANYTIKPNDTVYQKDGSGYRDYNLGAAHTLTITPNTDGDYVVPKNIKLYYQLCIKNAENKWVVKDGAPKIYLINPDDPSNTELVKFDELSSNEAVSVGDIKINKLGADEHYLFGLEGLDFSENEYVPEHEEGYGFRVAVSEIAPTVVVKKHPNPDNEKYFKQENIISSDNGVTGGVTIEGTIFEGSKKLGNNGVAGSDDNPYLEPIKVILTARDSTGALSGTKAPKALITLQALDPDCEKTFSWISGETVPTEIFEHESKDWNWSIKLFSAGPFDKENYNYNVKIVVSNSVKLSIDPIVLDYVGDNAAPTIKFTNTEFFKNGKDGDLNDKPIVKENSNQIDKATYAFTMNGTWGDIGGSSPSVLHYWYGTGTAPAIDASEWQTADGSQASSGNNKSNTSWFIQTKSMKESEGNTFAIWAEDEVGNKTDVIVVPNVMFDFGAPKVAFETCESVDISKKELNTKTTTLSIKGSVTDTHKFSATPIKFIVKKNGSEVTDTSIVSTTYTKTTGYTPGERYSWTVTLNAGSTHATEGRWTVEIVANDIAGRENDKAVTETINIDTTAPVLIVDGANAPTIGGEAPSAAKWHNTTTPRLKFIVEEAGGLDKVYYWAFKDGITKTEAELKALSLDDATGSYTPGKDGTTWTLNANAQSFDPDGKYWIYVRAVDDVGNESVQTNIWPVNVDTADPYLTYTLTEKQTNGNEDVSVTISADDETSGINKVEFTLKRNAETDLPLTPTKNDKQYTATVPKTALTKNGAVWATAYDNVGRKTKETKVLDITVDKTAPVLTITSVDVGETVITNDSRKSISQSGNDYVFSLEGKWSDVDGVGTYELYCSETSEADVKTKPSDAKVANAPETQSEKTWTKQFTIAKGDQAIHNYYLQAHDKVGNATAVQSRTGIKFDFENPTLTSSGAPAKQADKDIAMTNLASALVITITASDDRMLKTSAPVAFTIKKNNAEQSDISAVLDSTVDTNSGRIATYKITFPAGSTTLDGTWTIDASVTDDVGRTGSLARVKFLVDTTKPVIKAGGKLGGQDLTTNEAAAKWISRTDTPSLNVSYTEAGSGIAKLYYLVEKMSSTDSDIEGSFNMSQSGNDWSLTAGELKKISPQGKRKIKIWAEDNAGNESEKTEYHLWVDTGAPTLEYLGWKNAGDSGDLKSTAEFNTNIASDIIVGIESKDDVSGFDRIEFKIKHGSADAVALDVASVTGGYQIAKEKFTEGTNIVYATAYNKAGLNSGEKKLCTVIVDTTKPTFSITTVGETDTLITEKSVGSITNLSETQYQFTLGGKWSDIGGSGTADLYYSENNDLATKIPAGTASKAEIAVTSAVKEDPWSQTFKINVGDQSTHNYYVQAYDAVGNAAAVQSRTGIKFDFADPTITIAGAPERQEGKSIAMANSALTLTVTAKDDRKLAATPVTFAIKKNGAPQTAVSASAATMSDENRTAVYTIAFNKVDGTLDGTWTIEATVTDDVGRKKENVKLCEFMFDTQKPSITESTLKLYHNNNDALGGGKWYKNNTLDVKGDYTDGTSGVSKIYYWVTRESVADTSTLKIDDAKYLSITNNPIGTSTSGTFTADAVGTFEAGRGNYVYFMAEDAAGNQSSVTTQKQVLIDSTPPSAELDTTRTADYDYRTLTNNKASLVFRGTTTDAGNASGVKKLRLWLSNYVTLEVEATSTDATDWITVSGKGKIKLGEQTYNGTDNVRNWEAEIFAGALNGASDSTPLPLKYIVTDFAGTPSSETIATYITIDTTAPKPEIKSVSTLVEGKYVNKTFTVSGTNSDNQAIRNLVLKYKVGSETTWHEFGGSVADVDGTYVWQNSGDSGIVVEGNRTSWSVKIDSMEAFGAISGVQGKEITLVAVSTDEAGNASTEDRTAAQTKFTVDQNTDRPVIVLSTSIATKDSKKFVNSDTLDGIVTDDDGTIQGIWITTEPKTFAEASDGTTLDVNSWSYDLSDDGNKTLYFYVKDAEDGEFCYKYTPDSGATDEFGKLRFKESRTAATAETLPSPYAFVKDTAAPTINAGKASYGTPATEAELTSALYLGGTKRNTGKFVFSAKDPNGVASMSVVITNSTTETEIGKYTTLATAPTGYTKVGTFTATSNDTDAVWEIPFTAVNFDGTHWSSGLYSFAVSATDTSGAKREKEDIQVKVDFAAPTVDVEVTPSETIITSATVGITINDTVEGFKGAGLTGVKHSWAIPKTTETEATVTWTEISSSVKSSKQFAWADVSKYSNAEYATLNTTTNLWEVPIWFKVVDELGNTATVKKTLTIDKESSYAAAVINTPEDGTKVGSTTNISGIASISGNSGTGSIGVASIKEVRVQIDANGNGEYDADDYAILSGNATDAHIADDKNLKRSNSNWALWAATKSKYANAETSQNRLQGDASDWYILADVNGNNWSLTVKTSLLAYCYKGTEDRPNVKYRVKALGQISEEYDDGGTTKTRNVAMKDYDASGVVGADHIRPWTTGSGASLGLAAGVAERFVVIDDKAPEIKNIYLVQYKDNDPTKDVEKSRAYTKNMHIGPGQWYITASLSDETALQSYTLSEVDNNTGFAFTDVSEEGISDTDDVTSKDIIPTKITDSTTTSGKLELELSVVDNSSKTGQEPITINIDVTPPMLPTDLLYNEKNVAIGSNVAIENSDGTFKVGNDYNDATKNLTDEGGSEISYVAFWFERQPKEGNDTGKRVFNPMLESTKTGKTYSNQTALTDKTEATASANELFINSDGLAVMKIEGLTRSSDTKLALPSSLSTAISQNIRIGGLVKIGGSYVMISNKEGEDFILNEAVDTTFTEAYFVFAQVVNDKSSGADTYGNVGATDGDGMQENLLNKTYELSNGTKTSGWQWYGNINSANIPDGPIIVHVTAIDGAGNISSSSVTTSIANNRPRITKVMVASDWNNNGKFDVRKSKDGKGVTQIVNSVLDSSETTKSGTEFGEFVYYSTITGKYGAMVGTSDVTLTADNGNIFKVPNKLCVIPQFTGGNGNTLKYNWEVISHAATATTPAARIAEFKAYNTPKTGTPTALSTTLNLQGEAEDITYLTSDASAADKENFVAKDLKYKGGIELANTDLEGYDDGTKPTKCIAFTFWDETDETTQGKNSLYAMLKIPVVLSVKDTTKPWAKIRPFHWNDSKDNSVYQTRKDGGKTVGIKGHIELEDDLTDELKTEFGDTATLVKPKVSGQIILRGTVYDDVQLKNITVHMKGLNSNDNWAPTVLDYANGEWTKNSTHTGGGKVEYAKATNVYADQRGHLAEYEIVLNTESLTDSGTKIYVGKDKPIRVFATDWKDNLSQSNSYTYTADQPKVNMVTVDGEEVDDESLWTDYYVVDVVPYVTKVNTGLSTVKNGYDGSIYNRTALGHYPVSSETYRTSHHLTNSDDALDVITLEGYNLGGNTTIDAKTLKNGNYDVVVNTIKAVNNYNNNNAHGTAEVGDNYDDWYNRYQNKANNNELTDDIIFDVWEINSSAASSYDGVGTIREPVMKVNPDSGIVGLAFGNGPTEFSMPLTGNSYQKYQSNFATFVNVALAYDEKGRAHGTATGVDTYKRDRKGGRFTYFTSIWGTSERDGDSEDANFQGTHANRFESIGLPSGTNVHGRTLPAILLLEQRFYSPSIAVTTNGNTDPRVYLAYYDYVYNQIRFRAGTNNSNSGNATFGQFWHNGNNYDVFEQNNCSVIAGQTGASSYQHANVRGGNYVSIAVIPGTEASKDVVVATWFDADNNNWMYSYNTDPNHYADTSHTWSQFTGDNYKWSTPQILSNYAGEYCKIAVASDKSIHIACKSQSNEILYSYIKTYNGTPKTVKVESYEAFVSEIGLDVEVLDSKAIPYISYMANSRPKLAFPANATTGAKQGFASADDVKDGITGTSFNRNWEATYVPTRSNLLQDHINVATVSSALAAKNTSTSTNFHSAANDSGSTNHTVYVNGSTYPIMGYGIRKGTAGYMEIAQRKKD